MVATNGADATHTDSQRFQSEKYRSRTEAGGGQLIAFDWVLATICIPLHDLAEFLLFALGPNAEHEAVKDYLDLHRTCLEQSAGVTIDQAQWYQGYRYALMDLAVNRLALYTMAHTFRHYGFMARVCDTAKRLARFEFKLADA